MPARPDPLHNLLPDVAALAEIQSPVLPRFLRKVPLPDVDAEFRNAANNAKSLQSLLMHFLRSNLQQRLQESLCILLRN